MNELEKKFEKNASGELRIPHFYAPTYTNSYDQFQEAHDIFSMMGTNERIKKQIRLSSTQKKIIQEFCEEFNSDVGMFIYSVYLIAVIMDEPFSFDKSYYIEDGTETTIKVNMIRQDLNPIFYDTDLGRKDITKIVRTIVTLWLNMCSKHGKNSLVNSMMKRGLLWEGKK